MGYTKGREDKKGEAMTPKRKVKRQKPEHLINEGFVCKNVELSNSKCVGAWVKKDGGVHEEKAGGA